MQGDVAGVVICVSLTGPEKHVADLVDRSRRRPRDKARLNGIPQGEDLLSGEIRARLRNHTLSATRLAQTAARKYRFKERLIWYRCGRSEERRVGKECERAVPME